VTAKLKEGGFSDWQVKTPLLDREAHEIRFKLIIVR